MNRVGRESSIDIANYFITHLHYIFQRKLSLNFIDQNRLFVSRNVTIIHWSAISFVSSLVLKLHR
jgi:hypothetical protein